MKPQFEFIARRHPVLRGGAVVTGEYVEPPHRLCRARRQSEAEVWVMETAPGGSVYPYLIPIANLKPLDDAARTMMTEAVTSFEGSHRAA